MPIDSESAEAEALTATILELRTKFLYPDERLIVILVLYFDSLIY